MLNTDFQQPVLVWEFFPCFWSQRTFFSENVILNQQNNEMKNWCGVWTCLSGLTISDQQKHCNEKLLSFQKWQFYINKKIVMKNFWLFRNDSGKSTKDMVILSTKIFQWKTFVFSEMSIWNQQNKKMKHSSGHVFPDMVISDQENITLHWHIFPNMTILDQQNIEMKNSCQNVFSERAISNQQNNYKKNLRGHVQ